MEQKRKTSLCQYEEVRLAVASGKWKPNTQTLQQLLDMMEQELMIDGVSPLLSAAVTRYSAKNAGRSYVPQSFVLTQVQSELSEADSFVLVSCLAWFMSGNAYKRWLGEMLPYFCGSVSHMPMEAFLNSLEYMLMVIDQKIPQRRSKVFTRAAQSGRKTGNTFAAAWTKVLGHSRVKDDPTSDDQRDDIMSRLDRVSHWQEAQKKYSEDILELQKQLQEINMQMKQVGEKTRRIDGFLNQESIRKAHINLIELYNLIADTRDSQMKLAEETRNVHLENSVFNLGVFLDMISDYLDGYGIRTLSTQPGTAFNGAYHALPQHRMTADPKSLVVCGSIRNGFAWGEQVLQKEQVEVE